MNSCYIQNGNSSQRQNSQRLFSNHLSLYKNDNYKKNNRNSGNKIKDNNFHSKIILNMNQDRSQRKSSAPTSAEDEMPEPNFKAPKPIVQTKIRKTHCQIQDIPIPFNPQKIQQLYLSHNRIASVKNKLRMFASLRNLNLSYNLLSDVKQFIVQILGQNMYKSNKCNEFVQQNEQKKIQLKMLNLRMNKFHYGYQDQIIKYIKSLSKFEQYQFGQSKTTIYEKQKTKAASKTNQILNQQRQLIFKMASKASQYLIPAYCRIQASISKIAYAFQNHIQQSSSLLVYEAKKEQFKAKYEQSISKFSSLILPTKQLTYNPDSRFTSLKHIIQYELICLGLSNQNQKKNQFYQQINGWVWQNKQCLSYQKYINKIFRDIFKSLLFRFNYRKNYSLKNSLKQYIKTKNSQQMQIQIQIQKQNQNEGIQNPLYFQLLVNAFGALYGARKHKIHQPNTAKYLQKIDVQKVKQHPFVQYITFDKKQYYKNMNTLEGDRRKCKNLLAKQLQNYQQEKENIKMQKYIENWENNNFYQNFPIIVYERNYIQIITSILQEKVKQLIRVYDCFMRKSNKQKNQKVSENKHQNEDSLQKLNKSKIYINSCPYLQQAKQQNIFAYSPSPQKINAHEKQKQIIISKDKQTAKIKTKQKYQIKNKLQERPTISKFNINSKKQNIRLTQSSISFKDLVHQSQQISQEQKNTTKNERKLIKNNQKLQKTKNYTQINLNKYALHQINLVYKVLRALKKYKNKMRKKREKALLAD